MCGYRLKQANGFWNSDVNLCLFFCGNCLDGATVAARFGAEDVCLPFLVGAFLVLLLKLKRLSLDSSLEDDELLESLSESSLSEPLPCLFWISFKTTIN